jgi:RES domain
VTCRAPAPALDPLFERWPAGEVIHVIHDARHAPESFNPGVDDQGALRNPTRFAPIRDRRGKVVPYLYGGSTREGAIFETIFHNVPIDAEDKFVDLDDFAQRGHGQLVPARDLRLVDLTTDGTRMGGVLARNSELREAVLALALRAVIEAC